jgi:hypothetical protein
LPAVALCALVAHAVVYRSLWPTDGAHAYFGWYAPLVAALSAAALLGLPALLVVALRASDGDARLLRLARLLLPRHGGRRETVSIAAGALAFLVVQETLERSLQTGQVSPPAFAPAGWLVVCAALACLAACLTWVAGTFAGAVEAFRTRPAALRPDARAALRRDALARARRSCPLAVHGALRAPPLSA